MSENINETEKAKQLEKARLHAEAMQNRATFQQAARQSAQENKEMTAQQRKDMAKEQAENTKQAFKVKKAVDSEEESFKKDTGLWFWIFSLSILGDLLTLIPVLGSFFSFIFAGAIWFVYLIYGYYRNGAATKISFQVVTFFLEMFPIINMLPFFTASAFINYMYLSHRKKFDADF